MSCSLPSTFGRLAPVHPAHATLPILEGFDWARCLAGIECGEWYLVVFRSVRRADADEAVLEAHDWGAYMEAQGASGLLHYFRGRTNERGECLSFCIWESRRQALEASRLPLHQAAVRIANRMYASFSLERFILTKRPGAYTVEVEPVL